MRIMAYTNNDVWSANIHTSFPLKLWHLRIMILAFVQEYGITTSHGNWHGKTARKQLDFWDFWGTVSRISDKQYWSWHGYEIICIQFISIPFCFETTYWSLLIVVSKGMSIRLSSVYTNFRIFWISALQSLLVGNFVQLKLHSEPKIRRPRVLQRHGILFWPCGPVAL